MKPVIVAVAAGVVAIGAYYAFSVQTEDSAISNAPTNTDAPAAVTEPAPEAEPAPVVEGTSESEAPKTTAEQMEEAAEAVERAVEETVEEAAAEGKSKSMISASASHPSF